MTIFDIILIQRFSHLGAAYSEIVVNIIIAIASIICVIRRKYLNLNYKAFDTSWLKEWAKIGVWSGVNIFLSNIVYALVIVRMVNMTGNAGNYWIANEFIWKWLIVPITCLHEIVKKNDLRILTYKNTWSYCFRIVMIWLLTVPLWPYFLRYAMAVDQSRMSDILRIINLAMPFFVGYIICQMIEAWFISKGKTILVALTSAIVNIGYYGVVYWLFAKGMFAANIQFVICLFGLGMMVASICDIILYKCYCH